MNIVVCLKQVPDTNSKIRTNVDCTDIDKSQISYVLNPYDEYALEAALLLKEKYSEVYITAITVGEEKAVEVLRNALALGVDSATHVVTSLPLDALNSAKILSEIIKLLKVDIILCGRQAVDDDAFQVPGALSLYLEASICSVVSKIEVSSDEKSLQVQRVLESGRKQSMTLNFPCVLSCQKGINNPRFATLPGIMKAKKKEIKVLQATDFDLTKSSYSLVKMKEQKVQRECLLFDDDIDSQVKEILNFLSKETRII